ncbi:MAG: hypothetical protein ACOCWA_08535 [Bacteroidota bacterium]
MNTKNFKRFIGYKNRAGFRRKALIFSFFLLISIIIWLLKALEKNYTTEIKYPVRYRNFPDDKTLIGELPDYLRLNVYAHGYVLLQHKLSSRYIPLVISVNSFTLNPMRERDSGFYFLETRFLKNHIDKQLGSEFETLEVKPDTIVFPFAEMDEKRLPVKQNFDFQLDKQLILRRSPLILPDSITVTGPDYILDTLQYVSTENKDFGIISTDKELKMELLDIKHTVFKPEEIMVNIEVEKFTEKTLNVPVTVFGAPDSLNLITFPKNIAVNCQVGLSNYERLQPELFKAGVNYSEIQEGDKQLEVRLTRTPDFVYSIKYNPKTVEYLIQK